MRELKGTNRISLFRHVAQRIISSAKSHREVVGIMLLGGLNRGFADKFSDLDLTILLERKDRRLEEQLRILASREGEAERVEVDLEIHDLKDFERQEWNEITRWDFSKARIVFDRENQVKKILETKLLVNEEFWIRRIVKCAEYMKWYCCPPTENIRTVAESWIDRGDMFSAHYCLNYIFDLLIETVFALNREFLPPPKWRIFYFQNLQWLPRRHGLIVGAMKTRDLSTKELERRKNVIKKVWVDILPKIEKETQLTPEKIDEYYVKRILNQNVSR